MVTNENTLNSMSVCPKITAETYETENKIKIKPPQPIFVCRAMDVVGFRRQIITLICSENFLLSQLKMSKKFVRTRYRYWRLQFGGRGYF